MPVLNIVVVCDWLYWPDNTGYLYILYMYLRSGLTVIKINSLLMLILLLFHLITRPTLSTAFSLTVVLF